MRKIGKNLVLYTFWLKKYMKNYKMYKKWLHKLSWPLYHMAILSHDQCFHDYVFPWPFILMAIHSHGNFFIAISSISNFSMAYPSYKPHKYTYINIEIHFCTCSFIGDYIVILQVHFFHIPTFILDPILENLNIHKKLL